MYRLLPVPFSCPGLWASLGSEAGKTLAQRPRAAQGRSFGKIDYSSSSDGMPQARRAGATILSEPTDQDYGQREYAVRDPEGTAGGSQRQLPRQHWRAQIRTLPDLALLRNVRFPPKTDIRSRAVDPKIEIPNWKTRGH